MVLGAYVVLHQKPRERHAVDEDDSRGHLLGVVDRILAEAAGRDEYAAIRLRSV